MNKDASEIIITSLQQEIALEVWEETKGEYPLDFWEWYPHWCNENGYFNDRVSYQ